MLVGKEAYLNWCAPLGEGSVQGDVAAQSKSRRDQAGPSSSGHSVSWSPMPGVRPTSPI